MMTDDIVDSNIFHICEKSVINAKVRDHCNFAGTSRIWHIINAILNLKYQKIYM